MKSPLDDTVRREMLAFLPRLRRFTYGLTGSREEGDDLLQATCERAIRNIESWTPGTRLDSWMFRIARNHFLNDMRARNKRREYAADLSYREAHEVDGERMLESHLTYKAVSRFVATLPEEQRSLLLLVAVEGLSYQEASDALGMPIGTVASRLARARMALKTWIETPSPEDEEKQRETQS